MILVKVFGRILMKVVEFVMWFAELTIEPHKLSIHFSSNLSNNIDTSILVRDDVLVRVLTVSVNLVSDCDIPSLLVRG